MQTKLLLPQNIFSKILLSELSTDNNIEKAFLNSSLISKYLSEDKNNIGLIPTLDLLSHKELFVSSEIGISFNALLSNSYLHFKENQSTIENLFLYGDVSSNEVILSKILFKEMYDVEISPTLLKENNLVNDENILIVGDDNYKEELFMQGLSFSEEIIELINAPYVNYVLASQSEEVLKNFVRMHRDNFLTGHKENFSDLFKDFSQLALDFISVNIQHIVFDFEDQDLEGVKLLLQLPYYHGIVDNMIDIKFL